MKNLLPLLFTLSSFHIYCQTHSDCQTALRLCNKEMLDIQTVIGIGNPDDLSATCILEEFASTWFSWKIQEPGQLTFILTPVNPSDDLDFAIFKLNSDGTKTLVRCMAAGENVGDPTGSIPCLGSTGLSVSESDVVELAGCGNGNNNFLAPLDCATDEEYVMVVNNFSASGNGFTMNWGVPQLLAVTAHQPPTSFWHNPSKSTQIQQGYPLRLS